MIETEGCTDTQQGASYAVTELRLSLYKHRAEQKWFDHSSEIWLVNENLSSVLSSMQFKESGEGGGYIYFGLAILSY